MGVTGAVTVGGPGALFWMWVAGAFGMATAFAEATLAQLFKEKKENEYVGGLPFYGMKILGNRRWVGVTLAALFITYALLNVPSQTFHLFTALGSVASTIAGTTYGRTSPVYYAIGAVLVVSVASLVLGGLKRVAAFTDLCVPFMAVLYCGVVFTLIVDQLAAGPVLLLRRSSAGPFAPDAVFGGAFGVALQQGIKRGLDGQRGRAGDDHDGRRRRRQPAPRRAGARPVDGGLLRHDDHLLDGRLRDGHGAALDGAGRVSTGRRRRHDKLVVFMSSARAARPGHRASTRPSRSLLAVSYALFAFTTLIGMIVFAEISANMTLEERPLHPRPPRRSAPSSSSRSAS